MSDLVIGDIGNVSSSNPGMALSEIISRVRQEIRDAAKEFIGDDSITDYVNEAQEDLANRQRLLTSTASGATSGDTIPFPGDFIQLRSLKLGTGTDDLDIDEWADADLFLSWSHSGSHPGRTLAIPQGSTIELYPAPATGTVYTLRYVSRPSDLSADEDVSALPRELHPKLVYFAISRCFTKKSEWGRADRYMQMYEAGLRPHPQGRFRAAPAVTAIVPQATYFDSLSE